MSRSSRWGLPVLLLCAALAPALAQTAFERAPRIHGKARVENLIIGCSTRPEVQKRMGEYYIPFGHHRHSAQDWVSMDKDPEMKADIVASFDRIGDHIHSITGKVYLEHLNDMPDRVEKSRVGVLMFALFELMEPGATLVMDVYPAFGILDEPDWCEVLHWHSPSLAFAAGPEGLVSYNPFWVMATPSHFLAAAKQGSALDTFGGREAALHLTMSRMREGSLELPEESREKALKDPAFLREMAETNLDRTLEDQDPVMIRILARPFYSAMLQPSMISYLQGIGFTDVRIEAEASNPYNGRSGERWIVATRPPDENPEGDGGSDSEHTDTESKAPAVAPAPEKPKAPGAPAPVQEERKAAAPRKLA